MILINPDSKIFELSSVTDFNEEKEKRKAVGEEKSRILGLFGLGGGFWGKRCKRILEQG
jgi:hypothetical protein